MASRRVARGQEVLVEIDEHGFVDVVEHIAALRPDICTLDLNTMNSGGQVVINTPDNVRRIFSRFASVDPTEQQIYIPLDRKTARIYKVYWLHGFQGYRSTERTGSPTG